MLPKVAIVGRPNVGKSSIFNWLAGRRIAIVDPTAGVTRDRLACPIEVGDKPFELIDTGGIGIVDRDDLSADVEAQIQTAINIADVILLVVDALDGPVPLDREVVERLRSVDKPLLLVVNKCDNWDQDGPAHEFHGMGPKELLPISAKQNRNKSLLLQWISRNLPARADNSKSGEIELKLAIVGRRNTGKSTFINALAQEERTIVSEIPGTTRDSVDVRFERDSKAFIAIDTAGVRKKSKVFENIEFYSLHRAERSIRRADVVLLFLDASKRISKVDKQLTEYILKHHKPAIFVVNKWDMLRPMPTSQFADYLQGTFPSLDFVPIAFITAKAGKNVYAVLNLAQNLHKQAGRRITTGELNRVMRQAVDRKEPPIRQGRRPRIYYATQADVHPPTIVLFTNGPTRFPDWYKRYLLKAFRDAFPFPEVPINLVFRQRGEGEDSVSNANLSKQSGPTKSTAGPTIWTDV